MYLPTVESIKQDSEGTFVLTPNQYDELAAEASIAYSESGASNEADQELQEFETEWISTYLGTGEWFTESDEPDDGYDLDRYY